MAHDALNLNENATRAADGFNNVVDRLVMQNLTKELLPDLKAALTGVRHSGSDQVAALSNEDMTFGQGPKGIV